MICNECKCKDECEWYESYKKIALKAADILAMRYEPKGGYIRAWGRMIMRYPNMLMKTLQKTISLLKARAWLLLIV